MITTLQSPASGSVSASAFTAAKLYVRSTDSADTRTITVSGLDDSSATYSETLALSGKKEVLSTDLFTKVNSSAVSASGYNAYVFASGTAASGICYLTGQPGDGDTVTLGLTGFTQAYRFKDTPAQAFDVKIGADANTTASNLKKAINADGVGDGTDYFAGTTANVFLSAAVSGSVLTLTDLIPCDRQLDWANAKSGSNISVSNLVGGIDGAQLAFIGASSTSAYAAVVLDDESLTLGGLPGLVDWVSDSVQVSGKPFSIHLSAENVTTGIAASYEYSAEATPTTWRAGLSSISDLDNNSQVITPDELVEFVRLRLTNSNSAAASVNAKICFA